MNSGTIVAFLTKFPNDDLISFAEKLSEFYKIFVFIDDNTFDYIENDKINYVKIDNEECVNNGFTYTEESFISNDYKQKTLSSWDKALYYFTSKNLDYDNVWFIEDDVFIPSTDAFNKINEKSNNNDLVCAANKKGTLEDAKNHIWHWKYAFMVFEEEQFCYCSMVCCCRLSKRLLLEIKKITQKFNLVPLNEFLFNTLAMKNNFNVYNPIELSSIVFKNDWTIEDFNKNPDYLYHPIKDFNNHNKYRIIINN